MTNIDNLIFLKASIDQLVKLNKRLDKCTNTYHQRTKNSGFSRSVTTTYNANASKLAEAIEAELRLARVLASKL